MGLFLQKKLFSSLALPVATIFWSKIHLSQTLRPVPTLCEAALHKCRSERGLTKTVVLKGFDKLPQEIRNLKDSTSSDGSDSGGAQSDHTLPNVNLS